ncbi:unnamed protein product [Caenorhabditis auriculariae]|uniref:Bicarbonate transporter-like transmembrane domain-containing protein n=1 Tax=Caenorhabditis auriculariae TaxID=2777116 RepID=A0A8S1GV50_9PELO|nr:unnamed protein product [Caenorhabditis auriculariae]
MAENENEKKAEKDKFSFFSGMRKDIKNRAQYYKSDFTDVAKSLQSLTSVVFMFLATITPTVTFAALMAVYTGGSMGMIETLLSQCFVGMFFSLFSAQPLIIVSATGPVLVFEGSLHTMCESFGIDFLTIRLYAGIWVLSFCLLFAAFNWARIVYFVTRYTEDIFSSLISLIFFTASLSFLKETWKNHPAKNLEYHIAHYNECAMALGRNSTDLTVICLEQQPNTALLTTTAMFATFALSIMFLKIRQSNWFGRHFRNICGDFGVAISLLMVSITIQFFLGDIAIEYLQMPLQLAFTNIAARGHGLVVIPKEVDPVEFLASFVVALLIFILIFVETEITEMLLSRKDRKTVKGSGLHWDLVLIGFCTLVSSIFGVPWMCPAAVQSLAHCSSLTIEQRKAPGEQPKPVAVIEQRVTGFLISALIGVFALVGKHIALPTSALFGVFIYLGVMNLRGVKYLARFGLIFLPRKYFPNVPYVNKVSLPKIHLFTGIQTFLIAIVFLCKQNRETTVAFPFLLITFVLFRHLVLPYFYTEEELIALDGEEEEEEVHEPDAEDCYTKAHFPL